MVASFLRRPSPKTQSVYSISDGSIYAPGHDVTVNGGGTNGHVYGSIVGKTVTMTGVTNLHYDESLGETGVINNYKIVSWFEDNR